ncbi:type I-C CRISPR-associated endonuclease Cas1c [Teredinibacter turnerae]|uniref:type I-C CRISPR-associated endonuclease Cas1c n=1 Tax=Teredinibacter turnerae TaxID=2426 RepID=UPI00036A80DA|nr:type I-C CRISPR-associated endonuclease Cas1c [Teredinibacter turnerae]
MKKLQNSLFITRQKSYVHKQRETIVVEQESEKILQIPIHAIKSIFCFGNVMVSPFLLGFCAENGVGLAFFTEYGRFLARIQGPQSGNVLLRRIQYEKTKSAPLDVARAIIAAKIVSSRSVLQRHIRNYGSQDDVVKVIGRLKHNLEQARVDPSLDRLRGTEGVAAANYFSVFQHLVRVENDAGFAFNGRNKRPPTDPINAMLSFLYSVLGNDISAALQGVGFDAQVGFLHTDRPGRDSLAMDLLEELRAWWVDRLVLTQVNRREIKARDFSQAVSGAVTMSEAARKALLKAYQEKKHEEVEHPYTKEKLPIGLIPHMQAMLLASHLRGDLECYPPFVYR